MTDDQGHNDTAVPPKTTSAKEAALPLATTTREIYSTYMIYMYVATVRKILRKNTKHSGIYVTVKQKMIYVYQRRSHREQQR